MRGPRWVVSLRALVVVLAMLAAALGVLWLEAAGVQGVSAQRGSAGAAAVTVPPMATGTSEPQAMADSGVQSGAGDVPGNAAGGVDEAAPGTGPSQGAGGAGTGKIAAGGLTVHVVGAVNHPGVFVLGEGSRIFQAVEAAGGALPTAALAALNLAAPISDGQQIVVLTQEQAANPQSNPGTGAAAPGAAGGAAGGAGAAAPLGPVNVNTATAADLDVLPGIGPVLAQRIVEWRTGHGPFSSVDALDAVPGIGAKLLENLRSLVAVS
ncbi:competence protein ComEA [Arthrobacter stackebrandtii]|nr:competence protein ComEA [Arthrobacter stackebrandtii]